MKKPKAKFIKEMLDSFYLKAAGQHPQVAVRLLAEIVWQLKEIRNILREKKK